MIKKTQHFHELDGIRGLLANTVMLYHFGLNTIISKLTNGAITHVPWGICVDFFFILSGFVIAHSMHFQPKIFYTFVGNRFFRLVPLHAAILLIAFPAYQQIHPLTGMEFFENILGLSMYTGTLVWNMASWSMHLELYVPILFFIYSALHKYWKSTFILIFAASLFLQFWTTYEIASGTDNPILRGLGGLGLGYSYYQISKAWRSSKSNYIKRPMSFYFVVYILLIIGSGVHPLFSIALPLLSLAILTSGRFSNGVFSARPMQLMGRLSYSIYMTHAPILIISLQLMPSVHGSIPLKTGLILTTWFISYLTFYCIEKPGIAAGKVLMKYHAQ